MKPTASILLFFALLGCASGDSASKQPNMPPAKTDTLTVAAFTDTLQKLNKALPTAIDSAVHLYDMRAPNDSTGADTAAAALFWTIQDVTKSQNDHLQSDSIDSFAMLEPSKSNLSEKQKAFLSDLHKKKLKLIGDGEGGSYLVPLYETILPVIKAKTTRPVDSYLDLVAKEDTTPTFLDAGLAIEMPELVDRLVLSEQLLSAPLPRSFAADAARLNRFYTNALVNGADNSMAIGDNSTSLNDEFKKGYDYLLAKYPSTKAAAKINVWLAVVASGDKKKMDDFRKTVQ